MTLEHEDLLTRILDYIQTRDFRAVSACELAPDVVAVADTLGEVDVYFDELRWRFKHPEIWVRPGDTSPGSCTRPFKNVGLLQGVGSVPAIRSLEASMQFAKHHLTTDESISWYMKIKSLSIKTK